MSRYSDALEQQIRQLHYGLAKPGYFGICIESSQDFEIPAATRSIIDGVIGHQLLTAEPFFWAADICRVIEQSADGMPPMTLTPALLPAPAGFCWFEHALTLPLWGDDQSNLQALAWSSVPAGADSQVFMTCFVEMPELQVTPIPSMIAGWIVGRTFEQSLMDQRFEGQRRAHTGPPVRMLAAARYFAACLAFLDQRIFVTSQQRAERHAVKRLERQGWQGEPLVRVVELRRREHHSHQNRDADPATVPWSCQWVVSGHWRQQPYPSQGIVQPRWIMPYVKGPEDKPLKSPAAKVFAVVR